ncbi:MAG: rubredoxin [Eubacteriaceae bacterium]|nr:rubredoxin [Eubacteriaceae bacterium]
MRNYKCPICGYIYSEADGIIDIGIMPETKWDDVSDGFLCPVCKAPKALFAQVVNEESIAAPFDININTGAGLLEGSTELTNGQISAICSSLAKACEKQRLYEEMEAFAEIAGFYFQAQAPPKEAHTLQAARRMLEDELSDIMPAAFAAAKAEGDRGALRALVWSEKATLILEALLARYINEGESILENEKIYVCDICGFIYIGESAPDICPVCKVPSTKIIEVERRQ